MIVYNNTGARSQDETDIRETAARRQREIERVLSGSIFHVHVNTPYI